MSEEEKVNPVLKPTNKKFKFIDGWLVEVEESAMKLKITHKSGFYQCRVFCGEKIDQVFNEWSSDVEEDRGMMMSMAMTVNQLLLGDPEYMLYIGKCHSEYINGKLKNYTDEEHDAALEEVKKEYSERKKLEAEITPEVLEDIELNKQN